MSHMLAENRSGEGAEKGGGGWLGVFFVFRAFGVCVHCTQKMLRTERAVKEKALQIEQRMKRLKR